jgi:hypothetical protein
MADTLSTARTLVVCATGALLIGAASTLVMTAKVADAQMGGVEPSRAATCDGGRALCGDRRDGAAADLGDIATRDAEAAGCVGGRAACGDRRSDGELVRLPPRAAAPLDPGEHSRTRTR